MSKWCNLRQTQSATAGCEYEGRSPWAKEFAWLLKLGKERKWIQQSLQKGISPLSTLVLVVWNLCWTSKLQNYNTNLYCFLPWSYGSNRKQIHWAMVQSQQHTGPAPWLLCHQNGPVGLPCAGLRWSYSTDQSLDVRHPRKDDFGWVAHCSQSKLWRG